ncbi:MAG: phosphatidate cytidylyltransferase, partial [Actinobacteria bacterium]|nr:phosphatidate cytidylyltransferase [Actinomycetota bacterium]
AGAEAPASGEVYDVVEDDLDRAPAHDGPADITEDIYAGSVTMEHRGLAEAIAAAGAEDTELTALSAAMPGLDTGVVGFEDVEDLGTDEIYVPPARSDLGARIVTGIILIALLGASMWTSGGLLAGFIGIMVLIGLTEYFTTLRHKGYTPLVIFGYLGAIGALAGAWAWGPIAIPGAIAATTGIVYFFYAFAPRRRDALANGALTVLGMAWVTGTVAFAMPIAAAPDYRVLVFALVASTVAMDVGAYGFGRAWGSAPMAPVLSPNKSIEGLAGGVVLSIGVAVLVGYLFDPFTIQTGAALGLVVAVTAPLGDLAESMFKRSLGVKDMGAILPGHGGIMDRVDSFLFVIPPAWVLYEFLGYLS